MGWAEEEFRTIAPGEGWLKEEYPAIAGWAETEGSKIHRGDGTGVRSDCQHGHSYAPAGKTPVQQAHILAVT